MNKIVARYLLPFTFLICSHASFSETFTSNGVEIYYSVQGEGEPVVLIHGLTMTADNAWGVTGIIETLSADYQVIAVDTRGHGASGKPHDPVAYGDNMVLDVINLLDHMNISKANFIGYSMGGTLTQNLLINYPERVLKAVMAGSGWANPEGRETLVSIIAEGFESGNGLGPLLTALTPEGQPVPTPEELEGINTLLMTGNDLVALAAVARGFLHLDGITESEFRSNEIPLLYIVGEHDNQKFAVNRVRPVVSNAQFIEIPDADHIDTYQSPILLESIVSFLGSE